MLYDTRHSESTKLRSLYEYSDKKNTFIFLTIFLRSFLFFIIVCIYYISFRYLHFFFIFTWLSCHYLNPLCHEVKKLSTVCKLEQSGIALQWTSGSNGIHYRNYATEESNIHKHQKIHMHGGRTSSCP